MTEVNTLEQQTPPEYQQILTKLENALPELIPWRMATYEWRKYGFLKRTLPNGKTERLFIGQGKIPEFRSTAGMGKIIPYSHDPEEDFYVAETGIDNLGRPFAQNVYRGLGQYWAFYDLILSKTISRINQVLSETSKPTAEIKKEMMVTRDIGAPFGNKETDYWFILLAGRLKIRYGSSYPPPLSFIALVASRREELLGLNYSSEIIEAACYLLHKKDKVMTLEESIQLVLADKTARDELAKRNREEQEATEREENRAKQELLQGNVLTLQEKMIERGRFRLNTEEEIYAIARIVNELGNKTKPAIFERVEGLLERHKLNLVKQIEPPNKVLFFPTIQNDLVELLSNNRIRSGSLFNYYSINEIKALLEPYLAEGVGQIVAEEKKEEMAASLRDCAKLNIQKIESITQTPPNRNFEETERIDSIQKSAELLAEIKKVLLWLGKTEESDEIREINLALLRYGKLTNITKEWEATISGVRIPFMATFRSLIDTKAEDSWDKYHRETILDRNIVQILDFCDQNNLNWFEITVKLGIDNSSIIDHLGGDPTEDKALGIKSRQGLKERYLQGLTRAYIKNEQWEKFNLLAKKRHSVWELADLLTDVELSKAVYSLMLKEEIFKYEDGLMGMVRKMVEIDRLEVVLLFFRDPELSTENKYLLAKTITNITLPAKPNYTYGVVKTEGQAEIEKKQSPIIARLAERKRFDKFREIGRKIILEVGDIFDEEKLRNYLAQKKPIEKSYYEKEWAITTTLVHAQLRWISRRSAFLSSFSGNQE